MCSETRGRSRQDCRANLGRSEVARRWILVRTRAERMTIGRAPVPYRVSASALAFEAIALAAPGSGPRPVNRQGAAQVKLAAAFTSPAPL